MKILLTGANGFVGSHIAEGLVAAGYDLTCLIRKTSNKLWIKDLPIKYAYGNICDKDSLINPIKEADIIIHCAAVLRANDKDTYYKVNQGGTKNLVDTVLQHNSKLTKFIHISSLAAMGPSVDFKPKLLFAQETPVSDYGISKLPGEKELLKLNNKIPYTILRPAAVYGPRDKDILIFFKLVHFGITPFTTTERYIQLLFVQDIVEAIKKIIPTNISNYKTYVLGENVFYTWKQMSKTIAKAAGIMAVPIPLTDFMFYSTAYFAEKIANILKRPVVLNKQKIDEMLQQYWMGDVTSAVEDLQMDFTNLKIGAKITYSWYKEHKWL